MSDRENDPWMDDDDVRICPHCFSSYPDEDHDALCPERDNEPEDPDGVDDEA